MKIYKKCDTVGGKKKRKTRKGGSSTVQSRITDALHREYTLLINAIIDNDPEEVQQLLNNGSDPNETDTTYQWSPVKWAVFVYAFGVSDIGEARYYERQSIEQIIGFLENAGALNIPNERIELNRYSFEPIVFNGEIQFQQNEEDYSDDENENEDENNYSSRTSGGRSVKKSRKNRKSKKHKSGKKIRTNKRRKYVKK